MGKLLPTRQVSSAQQCFITNELRDFLGKFVITYIDNNFIYSESLDQQASNVKADFSNLQENKLSVKGEKCEFHAPQILFQGYIIIQEGVSMGTVKAKAVTEWPRPSSVKELQKFLGFVNFYCH